MRNVEKISMTIRKEILVKLKALHKDSGYRSFSEFIDKVIFSPIFDDNRSILTEEQAEKNAVKNIF